MAEQRTADHVTDTHEVPEVMNPPESAAVGSEARNLNGPSAIGHGVRPIRAAAAQATHSRATPRRPSVDVKSFALAEHFLSDQGYEATEDQKWELAGEIQRAVEDWLDGNLP